MKKIYKFQLNMGTSFVTLLIGAKILTTHMKQGLVCLWVELDPEVIGSKVRTFDMYGTGHEMPNNNGEYIGTIYTDGGLVFHVYERIIL